MANDAVDGDYEHYSPEHPLPSEIRNMRRDSTVCKYCGVSYLIHNEIKKLENKLAICEKELANLRGCEQREKDLQSQMNDLERNVETSKSELARRDKILNNMKSEMRETQEQLVKMEESKTSLEEQVSTSSLNVVLLRERLKDNGQKLKHCKSELQEINASYTNVKKFVKDSIEGANEYAADQVTKCLLLFQKHISELTSERDKVVKTNLDNAKLLKESQNLVEKLQRQVTVIEDKCIQMECKDKRSDEKNKDLSVELESLLSKNKQISLESQQFNDQLKTKTDELNNATKNLEKLKQENEENIKSLNTTINKQCLEVSRLKREASDWSTKYTEQQEMRKEMQRESSLSHSEIGDLKSNLIKAQQDVEALVNEREMSILAHQTQISDLRESFKNKLAEMENWPERLERALTEERFKHQSEMDRKLADLISSKSEEISILQEKHDKLLKKYTEEIKDSSGKHLSEISNLKSKLECEAGRWKKLLDESQARFEDTNGSQKSEIEGLKNVINDLELRIAKLGADSLNTNTTNSEDYIRLQQDLIQSTVVLDRVRTDLLKSQEEVCSLQETVRRECEERFELTESLSEAREELLSVKGINGGRLNSLSKTNSPPLLSTSSSNTSVHEYNEGRRLSTNELPTPENSPVSNRSTTENSPIEAIQQTEIGINVKEGGRVKSVGKIKGNSIAQHRRRIANLLGKK